MFRVDYPYTASSPLHAMHPSTPVAENVTRIVVEGSAAGRTEYLRLTFDPQNKDGQLFSYERVPLPGAPPVRPQRRASRWPSSASHAEAMRRSSET